jgi:hypothetical protein
MTRDPSTTDVLKTLTRINATQVASQCGKTQQVLLRGPFLAKYFSRALAWICATYTFFRKVILYVGRA